MAQDFFGTKPAAPSLEDDVDKFAKAISERSVLNPAMNAKALAPTKPNLPLPSSTFKPSSSFGFVEPKDLLPLINSTSALVIDIRPHAAYSSARIPTALSLSVPSTLLKRPLFSLDRLGAMLPSSSARARFTEWPKFSTIVVYDVDSTGSPSLPEGSNILGLLRKFSNDAAYSGNTLLWLKGGFQRVWRECRDLVDLHPPEPEPEDDSNESGSLKTTHLPSKAFGGSTTTRNSLGFHTLRKKPPSTLSLRVHTPQMTDKPSVASSVPFNPFFDTIRQNIELTQGATERIPLRLPKRVHKRIDDLPFEWLREITRRADVKPEDSLSSDGHDSTSSESHPHSPESSSKVLPPGIHENPTSTSHKSSNNLSQRHSPSLLDPALLEEGMEALATQFYHIELAEQKRLMGVMKHHSAESGVVVTSKALADRKDIARSGDLSAAPESRLGCHSSEDVEHISADTSTLAAFNQPLPPIAHSNNRSIDTLEYSRVRKSSKLSSISSGPTVPPSISESDSDRGKGQKFPKTIFPYSITAGVEKGAKNRYRHIWPFEHARVRLHLRRRSPPRRFTQTDESLTILPSTVSFPSSLPSASAPSIRPSGALTGPITSFAGSAATGASISRSASDATRSARSSSRVKNRHGVKPSFGSGGLAGISSPAFNFSSPALTAPVFSGFNSSALKPSFTHMRAPPPAAGSGGETTESEHEHDDSEKEASGREEQEEHDDYVNASYVQPLCTTRRYIATQGPLEATFVDFWTLVYQQNVHVIVMLTREIEGSMVKCGPYWKDEVFGPLRLQLISIEGNVDEGKDDDVRRKAGSGDPGAGEFFFSTPTVSENKHGKKKGPRNPADAIIKRTFLLSHVAYPDIPPRKIVQFQYLEWPDMNVPDDPRGVLGLIREVDQAVTEAMHLNRQGEEEDDTAVEMMPKNVHAGFPALIRPSLSRAESEESLNYYTGIANDAIGKKQSPVLLHCSAGVGRTGGFIAVDAVLDGVRRELRKKKASSQQAQGAINNISKLPDAMQVDEDNKERAVEDGQGNWNCVGNTDIDMGDNLHMIAIPANNRGNILHVPVHHSAMVRRSYYFFRPALGQEFNDGLLTPTASLPNLHASQDITSNLAVKSSTVSSNLDSRRTPMQVDEDPYDTLSISNSGFNKLTYARQPSTTRMWAEDVSDQTGSHGSAFRVDEAMQHMYAQDRLSEWDVPSSDLKVQSTHGGEGSARTSSRDLQSLDVNVSRSSRRSILLAGGQDATTIPADDTIFDNNGSGSNLNKPAALTSMFPLSSVDSASSSDDSYGFQSEFKDPRYHRSGHRASGSLSYGETALTSSTGTSFSSLQSLSGSAMPKSTSTQVIGGDQLSALNTRGEEARIRTLSAPSARYIQADAGEPHGTRHQASPFTSSPLVLGDRSRAVEKSPSPFLNTKGMDRDEIASPPPPSRSLSPNNRTNFSSAPSNHRPTASQTSHVGNSVPRINSIPTSRPSNPLNATLQETSARDVDHPHATQDVSSDVQQRSGELSYPRPLHNDRSPQALSTLEEPLMEVLQDMREQRMSLCQSLRQYVFVHAAVIEGALMIVDEERKREKEGMGMGMGMDIDTNVFLEQPRLQATPSDCEPSSTSELLRPKRRTKDGYSITSAPSTGKRVASPTELPKEDRKGDQMLFKRPSIKKKPTELPSRSTRGLEDEMV